MLRSVARCASRGAVWKREGLTHAVQVAIRQPECTAVLILIDGDDDCPAELGPTMRQRAQGAAGGLPVHVVLAHREYEAWFLAAIESLRGRRGIREDALQDPQPEASRNAKGRLEERMAANAVYSETTDQAALSQLFSLEDAYRRSRSFRKLADSFGTLLRDSGHDLPHWPPPSWTDRA